jgi:hypothetical protein
VKLKSNLNVIRFKRRPPMAKQDFTVVHHGSVVVLRPNTQDGVDWANKNIGKDNGYQSFWPAILLEPRCVSQVVGDLHQAGLIAR